MEELEPKASNAIILPRFVNIIDKNGKYMSIAPSDFLTCVKQEPDADCTFETILAYYPPAIRFIGNNGKHISYNLGYTNGDFDCSGVSIYWHVLEVIHVQGNQVYLHNSKFITNRPYSSTHNTLAASLYADSDCLFTISEPIISREIIEVIYDLPKALMVDVAPIIALSTTVRNDSQTSDIQQTLTYSYTHYKVGTWNNTAGIQLGVASSFSVGTPFLSANLELSVTTSSSREWGGSRGIEETVSSSTQITVPAGKKGTVIVIIKRKNLDVFFTCKERIRYRDGKTAINDIKGVYNNVESYNVDVQAGDWTGT